jgi:hypothetical protein
MAFHAGRSCVLAAALRFLSVDAAIEDRSIASKPAHKRFVLIGKGRLGVAIRQLPVAAPCMQNEIAVASVEVFDMFIVD